MPASKFGKNIVLLIAANIIIKPFYILGIESEVQNMVGPEAYGLYFGLFNFCFLFTILLDAGIQNYNSKWVAENRDNILDQVSQTIWLKFFLGILFLIIVLVMGLLIGYPLSYYNWLPGIVIFFFLSSFYVYLKSHFPALGKYSWESFFSIFDKILLIIFVGYQIYILKRISVESFIFTLIGTYILTNICVLMLLKKVVRFNVLPKLSIFKNLLKSSFAFALVSLFTSMLNRMDGVMLERLLDDNGYSAGVYAACFRLLDASNMFAFLFASLLVPMFASLISQKESILPLLKESGLIMFCLCISLISTLYFQAEDILHWLYLDANDLYINTFKVLYPGFLSMGLGFVFGSLLIANGKLKALNILLLLLIGLNFGLNYWIIPLHESVGAAGVTLLSQALLIIGEMSIVYHFFRPKWNFMIIIKMLVFLILSLILGFTIQKLSLNWILEIVFCGLILSILSFLLGLIRLNTLIGQKENEV